MFLGIVSSIVFCIVGANLVSSLISPLFGNRHISILVEYIHQLNRLLCDVSGQFLLYVTSE
jgi:hypothetical protein